MLKKKYFSGVFFTICLMVFSGHVSAEKVDKEYEKHCWLPLEYGQDDCVLSGDFDGDGKMDEVFLSQQKGTEDIRGIIFLLADGEKSVVDKPEIFEGITGWRVMSDKPAPDWVLMWDDTKGPLLEIGWRGDYVWKEQNEYGD